MCFDHCEGHGPNESVRIQVCECGHERWQHPSDLSCLVASDHDGPWDDDCQQFREATEDAQ